MRVVRPDATGVISRHVDERALEYILECVSESFAVVPVIFLVTQGQVRLTVGSEDSDLVEGDSFQFPSSIAHKLSNPYGDPAQVIWIMSVVDSHI